MKKFKQKIKDILFKVFPTQLVYSVWPKPERVIILDNYFPNRNCGFKMNEYNYLLEHFPNSEVYSSWPDFDSAHADYQALYPQYQKRVKKFSSLRLYPAQLFYISFLHNTHYYLPIIEREKTPFIFTLYGGGFFGLDYPESDAKLKAVFSSPYFRKVIVSQTITAKYLVEKGFTKPDKIELVYGSSPSENLTTKRYLEVEKKVYPEDKKTFDICFVGRRHTPQGKDKGYHLFIAAAQQLAEKFDNFRFHVAGDFNENTIPIGSLGDKITFYQEISIEKLPAFFADKDIYLSPNLPNQIHPGSFEGITGTCQEAAIAGTAVFCCDVLKLNLYFTNHQDIVFTEPSVDDIVKQVSHYYEHLPELYQLSKKGQKKFLEVFDFDKHMGNKARIINSVLSESKS